MGLLHEFDILSYPQIETVTHVDNGPDDEWLLQCARRRALPSPLEGAFGVTLPEVGALPQPVIFACALPKGLFPSYASLADLLLAAVIAERKGRETAH